MPWARRVLMAQALEYLRERCEPQMVHGDAKVLNMLVDATMSAKLCDFGSARMGVSTVIRPRASAHTILDSPGYVDLHYIRSGVLTTQTDRVQLRGPAHGATHGHRGLCPTEGHLLTAVLALWLKAGDARMLVDEWLGSTYDAAEASAMATKHPPI